MAIKKRYSLKRLIKYFLLLVLVLLGILVFQNYPNSAAAKNLVRLSDTVLIRQNLETIINTPKKRNFQNVDVLDSIADYIQLQFLSCTKKRDCAKNSLSFFMQLCN